MTGNEIRQLSKFIELLLEIDHNLKELTVDYAYHEGNIGSQGVGPGTKGGITRSKTAASSICRRTRF